MSRRDTIPTVVTTVTTTTTTTTLPSDETTAPRATTPTTVPAPTADPVSTLDPRAFDVDNRSRSVNAVKEIKPATKELARRFGMAMDARATVGTAQEGVAMIEQQLAGLSTAEQRAAQDIARTTARIRQRAVLSYMGGNDALTDAWLNSLGTTDFAYRSALLEAVQASGRTDLATLESERDQATTAALRLTDQLAGARQVANVAATAADSADRQVEGAQTRVDILNGSSSGPDAGFLFPVATDDYVFGNDWGYPRPDLADVPRHRGNDIFADKGTPLVAVENGVISKVGWNELGGWRLWLQGDSGAEYYYAHLSKYAPDLAVGEVMKRGDLVGFVGDSGDAQGGPYHLHFEIHPWGADKDPINPYPVLKAAGPKGTGDRKAPTDGGGDGTPAADPNAPLVPGASPSP